MNPARLIQLENALRLIAMSTTDGLAKAVALDILDESPENSRAVLAQSCWSEYTTDLRSAVIHNLRQSSNTAVVSLVCD